MQDNERIIGAKEGIVTNDDENAELEVAQKGAPLNEKTDDEKIDAVAARILEKYKPAFQELAK